MTPEIRYVLFHETNSGSCEGESDGFIEAIYTTADAAEAARLVEVRKALQEGKAVFYNPDTEEENEHWTDDWRVEVHQTIGESPAPSPVTRWAAYSGSAAGGSEISLHATEWDATEAVSDALGLEDDPDVIAAISALDLEALRTAIEEYCNAGADDWHVQEVTCA